ncbi:MAG: thioesterase family protein [Aquisalinus sp.]|nr:thioesterase family protein [Aquisalinus sp.]
MSLKSFADLMSLEKSGDDYTATITEDWQQGRSTFGGLSAALCLQAAYETGPDLPPLQSAQVSFIGPAAGDISLTTSILRQGKNVTFLQSDLLGEKGLATRAVFCFGSNRESTQSRNDLRMPSVPKPDASPLLFEGGGGPGFAVNHFDQRLARGTPAFGGDDADNQVWVRFKERNTVDDMLSLIAIADALPPAELSAFKTFAPISTMTWLVNFLTDTPVTENGWWLVHARAEHTENGYSSQNMIGWSSDGRPVFSAKQSIAVFA